MLSASKQGDTPTEDDVASPGSTEVAKACSLRTAIWTKVMLGLKLLYSLCVAISENIILKSNLVVTFYYEAALEQGWDMRI